MAREIPVPPLRTMNAELLKIAHSLWKILGTEAAFNAFTKQLLRWNHEQGLHNGQSAG